MANFANLKNFQFLTLEVHSGKSTPENPTGQKQKVSWIDPGKS